MRTISRSSLHRPRWLSLAASASRPAAAARDVQIHPSAIVEEGATLHDGVVVGPYCYVGPDVILGPMVTVDSHAVLSGRTRIGAGTRVFSFAAVGGEPQDKKYDASVDAACSSLVVGPGCTIREHVTINAGTKGGGGSTSIGGGTLLMAGVHIGHDCHVGDEAVVANGVGLAGHCTVGHRAVIGGLVGVKQYVTVGELAMVGGGSVLDADVPPYTVASGNRAQLLGINLVGLRRTRRQRGTREAQDGYGGGYRGGHTNEDIRLLLQAFRYLFNHDDQAMTTARTSFAPPLDLPWAPSVAERARIAHSWFIEESKSKSEGGGGGGDDAGTHAGQQWRCTWDTFFDFVSADGPRGTGQRPMPLLNTKS